LARKYVRTQNLTFQRVPENRSGTQL
jgi:hypothetical protein